MTELKDVCLDAYTKDDENAFLKLASNNTAAIFVYNKNILSNGERAWIDPDNYRVRPEYRSGRIFAPLSVFGHLDGVEARGSELSFGGKTVVFKTGERKYTVCDAEAELEIAPFERYEHLYIPIEEASRALGIGVALLYQNRLAVFGAEDSIRALVAAAKENTAIEFAGGAAVIGEYEIGRAHV